MLVELKVILLRRGIRQTRMALELGWDPAKLSRIINETKIPSINDRAAIAAYLNEDEAKLFEQSLTPSGRAA